MKKNILIVLVLVFQIGFASKKETHRIGIVPDIEIKPTIR
jgi:hypothetical protein